MKTKVIFGLFVGLALLQVAVPIGQVVKHEDILRTGTPYKFRTAPVDPYDAFRGRYVALNYADTLAKPRAADSFDHYRRPAYVTLTKDAAGFAQFGEISLAPPGTGDFLRVTAFSHDYKEKDRVRFGLPFDRFYMEESKAPQAEAVYRSQRNRPGQTAPPTYVLVRVKDGRGVIENLYVQDKPIRQFLSEGQEPK